MKQMYGLIRTIVTQLNGFSVNDVLQTNYDALVEILCTEHEKEKEEAQSLHDFVRSLG